MRGRCVYSLASWVVCARRCGWSGERTRRRLLAVDVVGVVGEGEGKAPRWSRSKLWGSKDRLRSGGLIGADRPFGLIQKHHKIDDD